MYALQQLSKESGIENVLALHTACKVGLRSDSDTHAHESECIDGQTTAKAAWNHLR
jgi:hypothetical protein